MKRFKPGQIVGDLIALMIVAGLLIGAAAFLGTMAKWLVWAVGM